MNARTWTQQQTAVFRWLDTPTARRALAVNARAGTGKRAYSVPDVILAARAWALTEQAAQVGQVACCTVHRSKGLEARAVWIIADSFRDSDSVEEQNLRYVAITRAIGSLHIVGEGPFAACLEAALAAPQMRFGDLMPVEEDFGPDDFGFDETH